MKKQKEFEQKILNGNPRGEPLGLLNNQNQIKKGSWESFFNT